MYRLLIVDDEPYIVDGLADLCEGAVTLDVEVYKSYSASEALSWLKRTKIDIVLSDIKMPGLSGLALQKEIRRYWPNCKIIFLTGHDQFSYIQEATRGGSIDYILKAEGNDAVLSALEKGIRLLDQDLEAGSLVNQAKENMRKALPFLQKSFVLDWLQSGPEYLRTHDIQERFIELDMPLHAELPCLMLLCRVDTWNNQDSPGMRSLYLYAIENIMNELLSPMVSYIAVEYDRAKMVWLLQYREGQRQASESHEEAAERVTRFVHGTLEQIQRECRTLLKLKTSFAASNEWVPWRELPSKLETLRGLLSSGLGIGHESLLVEMALEVQPAVESGIKGRSRIHLKKIELLRGCLDNGEQEEFYALLAEIMSISDTSTGSYEFLLRMEIYYELVAVFIPHIVELQEGCGTKQINFDELTEFKAHEPWEATCAFFRQLADLIFSYKEQNKYEQQHEVIIKVNRYIEEHLAGDLSLTQIGEMVGHNPSYLSRLYKQITGEGLSESITAARLAKAKELLNNTNLKVHEVAAAVGFISPPYFYRFFKKATHLTPQEYRELKNT